MDSKVAQKLKIENQYSNISHIYKIIKGTLMLITEVLKFYGRTNCFHH